MWLLDDYDKEQLREVNAMPGGIFSGLLWTDRKTERLLTHRLHMNADALRLRTLGTAVSACIFGKVVEVL